MNGWVLAFGGTAAVMAVIIVITAFRGERPLRTLFSGAVEGLCALAAVNITAGVTGVAIGLNGSSLAVAGVFGIPGVIGLLTAKWMLGI